MIRITVNGKNQEISTPISIAKFIENCGYKPQRCVVELNAKAMRFEEFAEIILADGDVVEVMSLVAGG